MAKKKKKPGARPTPPQQRPVAPKPTPTGPSPKEIARLQRERAARRARLRKRLGTLGLILLLLTPIAGYVVWNRVQSARLNDELTVGTCTTDSEMDRTRPTGQNHIPNPVFNVDPPAGGDHTANVSGAGITTVAAGQEGPVVHALEHGYIVLWHKPDLPEEQMTRLQEVYEDHERDVLLVERASMAVPVAATAWGERLLCQEVEPDVLERFVDAYVNEGPEKVDRP